MHDISLKDFVHARAIGEGLNSTVSESISGKTMANETFCDKTWPNPPSFK
jgi:hypothetical protein